MQRHARRFLLAFALAALPILACVAGFNWLADPTWAFEPPVTLSSRYILRDERQNRVNRLFARNETFDGVLLGSSRMTYFDVGTLPGRVYNFSASRMFPYEYVGHLATFVAAKGRPGRLYLAIDFFGSSTPDTQIDAARLRTDAQSWRTRASLLLSLDVLFNGLENIVLAPGAAHTWTYDRMGRRHPPAATPQALAQQFEEGLAHARRSRFYGSETYRYNAKLGEELAAVRAGFPDAEIVVFTSPISIELFALLVTEGRFDDYARWLTELVTVFGNCVDFMGDTGFARRRENWIDTNHFWPSLSRHLATALAGGSSAAFPDFGQRVDAANLAQHLARQRRFAERLPAEGAAAAPLAPAPRKGGP
ncbi:MAG: hypothetical protein FJX68_12875 [Alphaproteobacteria bacterium]|nr:hypothetical protein [Alphaproteobacteria bacterium]